MTNRKIFGALLAASLTLASVAGCKASVAVTPTPPGAATGTGATQPAAGTSQPGATTKPATGTANAKTPAAQTGAEAAAALSEEREAEDLNMLADEGETAKYAVFVVGGPVAAPGGVAITATGAGDGKVGMRLPKDAKAAAAVQAAFKAKLKADVKGKLDARKAKIKEKVKVRLDKLKDARAKVKDALAKAEWVANGDGTETKTIEVDVNKTVNGKTMTRHRKIERTRNVEDKTLVNMTAEFSSTGPNGATSTMTRTKTLQEDGSYKVVFNSEVKLAKGAGRRASWEKTISADGAVSGTGKIEWFDATGKVVKTVDVKCGGTEEAEKATCTDAATKTEATVTVPAEGDVTATATEATGATAPLTLTTADDGTVASPTESATDVSATGEVATETDAAPAVTADATATAAAGTN